MMIRRNKAKKQMDKFHITAIIERSIHYPDKKTGITKYTYEEKKHPKLAPSRCGPEALI